MIYRHYKIIEILTGKLQKYLGKLQKMQVLNILLNRRVSEVTSKNINFVNVIEFLCNLELILPGYVYIFKKV